MKDCYTEGIYCEDKEFALSDSNQIAIAEVLNKNSAVGVVGGYYDAGLPIKFISLFMISTLGYESFYHYYKETGYQLLSIIYSEDKPYFEKDTFARVSESRTYRLVKKDGETLWVKEIKMDTVDSSGRPMWILSLNDVNDFCEREKNLMRISAAKSEFLASMSHDIRTPLNVIMGMTALAESSIYEPGHVADCLSNITIAVNHLLALIDEVLDIKKLESGVQALHEEPFLLSEVCDNLMMMSKFDIASKKHTLHFDMKNVVHRRLIGNQSRIQQVFMNLLSNAVKYTPDGGIITVTVQEKPTHTPNLAYFEYVVEDNGIGMSKEFIQHIFEPFMRENDVYVAKRQGTGLGMAIARNIVQMMKGDIKVKSKKGVGSRITAYFYIKFQDEDRADDLFHENQNKNHEQSVIKTKAFEGKRLLLAEDNKLNERIAVEILKSFGFYVDSVNDGKKLVDMALKSQKNYYDVILMDIKMPVMDGYEATHLLRLSNRTDLQTIPIIAMTANVFASDIDMALAAGMNEHITKPIDWNDMFKVLQKILK